MRKTRGRKRFREKIREASQFVRLAKRFPQQPPSASTSIIASEKEKMIVNAIRTREVLDFSYNGEPRVVEPQSYGISTADHPILRGLGVRISTVSASS